MFAVSEIPIHRTPNTVCESVRYNISKKIVIDTKLFLISSAVAGGTAGGGGRERIFISPRYVSLDLVFVTRPHTPQRSNCQEEEKMNRYP